jgi:hypothetical protein
MHWSAQELSAFFESPVLPPESPDLPHTLRFEDDLICGEFWIHPKENYALVTVRRGMGRQDLFEFSVPCRMIKTDVLSGGTPAVFFFTGEIARTEDCSLHIAKNTGRQFAFYPALRAVSNHAQPQ